MSKCPHCGAEFQFDASSQLVHCEYCGSDFNPQELPKEVKTSKIKMEGRQYSCTQCGATLLSFDETAVTFCSYCGSQNILEERMVRINAPEYIIPFSKTQKDCFRNYKRLINRFLFCPSYLKSNSTIQKFRGIYMPYGVYKFDFHGDYTTKGKRYSHRVGNYVYYNDFKLTAPVDASYQGLSYDLIAKYYDEYSQAIPFNFKDAVPYNPNYLPGFYADTMDVDISTYEEEAKRIANVDANLRLQNWTYSKYSATNLKLPFDVNQHETGMFPVYFMSVKDPKNGRLYYAIINGQTGKAVADLPISFAKYLAGSLLLGVLIFIMLYNLPVIIPFAIDIFAVVMAVISNGIYISQIKACNNRYLRIGDKGFYAKDPKTGRALRRKPKKIYHISKLVSLKYALAIALPFLPILFRVVSDSYYYMAATVSLALILWSFYDLVKIHNQLVSRPIPQLDKRGGDEHD